MDKIKKCVNQSTSPNDIFRIAGKRCNVFTYPEIRKYKKLLELFRPGNSFIASSADKKLPLDNNACIILYMSGPNYGHWTALVRNKYGVNFMDSYGGVIDDQLEHVDQTIEGQDKKYLIQLLKKCKKEIYYNDFQMQTMNTNVKTCGRYCAVYLKNDHMKVDDFVESIKRMAKENDMTCDEVICALSIQVPDDEA